MSVKGVCWFVIWSQKRLHFKFISVVVAVTFQVYFSCNQYKQDVSYSSKKLIKYNLFLLVSFILPLSLFLFLCCLILLIFQQYFLYQSCIMVFSTRHLYKNLNSQTSCNNGIRAYRSISVVVIFIFKKEKEKRSGLIWRQSQEVP